jgi:hypothetical protein
LREKTVSLAIFLPEGSELVTCLRLRCLNVEAAAFVYDADYYERPIDIRNGNLTSSLDAAQNNFTPLDTPEGRLELALRRNIDLLDGRLLREPVYGQVPAFTGHDRGVLDLLAVESTGRLCVVELKASEDIHLPIQALDYWMRVAAHNERGDFARYGYFPGLRLSNEPPRIILAAPAMHFHPATHTLLRYYAPQIEVDRAGLAFARQHLPDSLVQSSTNPVRVAFRLHGSEEPWHLTDDAAIPDRRNSKIHRATQPARGG